MLIHLGDTEDAVGDHDAARSSWRQALAIFEELGNPFAEVVRAKLDRGAPSD